MTRDSGNDTTGRELYDLSEMTWPEVKDAVKKTGTLLLPLGSTEQHGHHLPLGVDVCMPAGIAEQVAHETNCLVAPPVWYGVTPHHTFKPGTFTIESETFQRYVYDICASAGEWGIENIILLNGHYLAQDPELDIVVRQLRTETGIRAFNVPLVSVFEDAATTNRQSNLAFHAAELETSCMLALHPELVHLDRAVPVEVNDDPLPLTDYDAYADNRVGWALSADDMAELTDAGNVGDPTVATAEFGQKLIDAAVSNISDLVEVLEADRTEV